MLDNFWLNLLLIYWLSLWAIFLYWYDKQVKKNRVKNMNFLEMFFALLLIGIVLPIVIIVSLFKKNK